MRPGTSIVKEPVFTNASYLRAPIGPSLLKRGRVPYFGGFSSLMSSIYKTGGTGRVGAGRHGAR